MSGDPGPLDARLDISKNAGRVLGAVWIPRGGGDDTRNGRFHEDHYRPSDAVRKQLGLAPDDFHAAVRELLVLGLAATRGGRRELVAIEWRIVKREREVAR